MLRASAGYSPRCWSTWTTGAVQRQQQRRRQRELRTRAARAPHARNPRRPAGVRRGRCPPGQLRDVGLAHRPPPTTRTCSSSARPGTGVDRSRSSVAPGVAPIAPGADDATLIADAESMLAFLANHRSTAEYICWKLARRFVSDDPPEALVQRLADEFQATGTDITATMRLLLNSAEFKASGGQKVRRGLETVVSYVRTPRAPTSTPTLLAKRRRTCTASAGTRECPRAPRATAVQQSHARRLSRHRARVGQQRRHAASVGDRGSAHPWLDRRDHHRRSQQPHPVSPLPATMGEVIEAMVLNADRPARSGR